MDLGRTGPRACGRLGITTAQPGRQADTDLPTVLDLPRAVVAAEGAVLWQDGTGASWSPRPLPSRLSGSAADIARAHDAISVADRGDHVELHSGISGAVPMYVDPQPGGVHFCSSLTPLLRARSAIEPDWDGWAQMLAAGAPLAGRTTVAGIRRLRPWERVTVDDDGRVTSQTSGWPWLELADTGGSTEQVAEALAATVEEVAQRTPLAPMLSGGWDSRILTTLAARVAPESIARTTSSDTGTVMEELIAAKVAEHLGLEHRILMPRRDEFGADVDRFARAVDHQTAFHVWFVPIQRDLDLAGGTALDGLGGGLFLGGDFSSLSSTGRASPDERFARLTRYLRAGPEILAPRAMETLRDRTRAGFDAAVAPFQDHPFADTFTAYCNRTLPGISLAPYGLLAASTTVATPFLDDRVVSAALQIPAEAHDDGRLYPKVLSQFDPDVARIPTAQELVPWPRPHPRRIASTDGARYIRGLVLAEPVRPLIADALAAADLDHWSRLLSTTDTQHLLRSLAVMSLWFTAHHGALAGRDATGLLT